MTAPSTLAAIAESIAENVRYFDEEYTRIAPEERDKMFVCPFSRGLTVKQLRALHAIMTSAPPPQSLLDTLIQKAVFSEDVTIWHLTQPEYYAIKALVEAAAPQPAPLTSREGRTGMVNEAGGDEAKGAGVNRAIAILMDAMAFKPDYSVNEKFSAQKITYYGAAINDALRSLQAPERAEGRDA